MKSRFKEQFNTKKLAGSLIGMLLVFIITTPVIAATTHLYERFSPTAWWFEYYQVRAVETSFEKDDPLRFNSFIEYRQAMDIRWEDTLFCLESNDGIKKYQTQFWPEDGSTERKNVGRVNVDVKEGEDLAFWEYYVEKPDEFATDCYLQGVAIGSTPRGYEKTYFYVTDTFEVNQ